MDAVFIHNISDSCKQLIRWLSFLQALSLCGMLRWRVRRREPDIAPLPDALHEPRLHPRPEVHLVGSEAKVPDTGTRRGSR